MNYDIVYYKKNNQFSVFDVLNEEYVAVFYVDLDEDEQPTILRSYVLYSLSPEMINNIQRLVLTYARRVLVQHKNRGC